MPGRNSAWLGLGGNIGDPRRAMVAALRELDSADDIEIRAVSSLYRTPPWGVTDQPDFLNAVAEVETALSPHALLARCLEVERSLKRVRRERWGPRIIDIDILLHGMGSYADEGLQLPHPRMFERAFVLVPLAEIAPGLVIEGRSVEEWLAGIDASGVVRLPDGRDWWKTEA